MACDGEAARAIESHAIGTRFRTAVGFRTLVTTGLQKDADAVVCVKHMDLVSRDICEEKIIFPCPYGAFGPGKTSGHSIENSVFGHNQIEIRIEPFELHRDWYG